jgi:glycosyltransferase involved in cell wall biosynthesis
MDRKLKIAVVSTTSSVVKSFMINHITTLSTKYAIFVYCNNADELKNSLPDNVVLTNINIQRKPNLFSDILIFLKLTMYFFTIRFNFCFSITPKAGFIAMLSSSIARIPNRIHWFTGQIWVNYTGFRSFFFTFLDKITFKLSNHVLVDSDSQRNFLINKNIISKKKSTTLHKGSVGGIDVNKFKFSPSNRHFFRNKLFIPKDAFVFFYLGRITRDKGIPELIRAYKKNNFNNNFFLVLAGPLEDESLKKLILDVKRKIIYIGSINNPEKWFSIADIICLPSYREGFGNVIIEAASCQVPALASNIYGITDALVANRTGILHKAGNVKDIQKKMLYIINNKNLVKQYGKKARKNIMINFNQNLLSQKLLEFINLRLKLVNLHNID